MKHYTKFLCCFLVLGVFLSLSYAQETPEKAIAPAEVDSISEKGKASIVRIGGRGTGFFITKDKIATNFHVAARFKRGPVFAKSWDKKTIWRVKGVTAFDIKNDIAILTVATEGTPLPLGNSDMLQIDDPVFLVGYPYGKYKGAAGVVNGIQQNDGGIRTTIEAYPGNSGSPLLNSKGEIIGIHYGHDPGNSPVYAIKALLMGATSTESFTQWRKQKPIQAHLYTEQGKAKYDDGDAKGAINDFNQVIELTPDDAEIYKLRAKSKVKLEDYQAAIDDYNQAIKLNPEDASAYKERAEAKRKLGHHPSAIDDYNQATQLNPKNTFTYRASADAKRKSGDYTGAIEDYNQAIKLNPKDAEAYKKRGKAKAKLGDDAGAIEDYSQALKLNPKDVFTYDDRASIKQKLGDYSGAIEDYNQIITKLKDGSFTYTYKTEHGLTTVTTTPDDSYVYYVYNSRGWAKRKQGDHTGAIEDFTRAIEHTPDDTYGYNNRGWVKMEIDDYAGAIEDFTHAIKLKPDDTYGYNNRGHAKTKLGKYADAIADYDKAIDINPKHAVAYHNRGLAKEALGQHEAAQIDFEKAKALESKGRKGK